MRKFTLIMFGIAVAAIAASAAAVSPITWKATSLELGKIGANAATPLEFTFTNTGEEAVYIMEAKGSCGCTAVAYPKEAIAPGEKASISASFKSAETGMFKKNIKIRTSVSEEYTYLYFSGEVVS